jgi:NAD(P)H-hydrate epimerase
VRENRSLPNSIQYSWNSTLIGQREALLELGWDSEVRMMKKQRFFTDTNQEVPALTTSEMREVDRIALQETGPNLFQMMENAGRNLAEMALECLGRGWQQARVVVLAGGGGNGGGGITAARHLANRGGRVELCLAAPDELSDVTAWQRKIFSSTSGREVEFRRLEISPVHLILDALIGYGLQSAPQGAFAELIRWANGTGAPIISLDVPSGIDSTTGATPGEFIRPSRTMTLALPKSGLAHSKAGELVLADIGIPEETYRRIGVSYISPFGNRFRVPISIRAVEDFPAAAEVLDQGSRRKS